MNETTLDAFFDELDAIEKDAGLREALKSIKETSKKGSKAAKKLTVRAAANPHVQKALRYFQDPMNTADLAQSVSTLSRLVG